MYIYVYMYVCMYVFQLYLFPGVAGTVTFTAGNLELSPWLNETQIPLCLNHNTTPCNLTEFI